MNENENITPSEFMQLAQDRKVELIDRLASTLISVGMEYATVSADFYSQKYGVKSENFPQLAGRKAYLEIRYDVQKHLISSLQSTLKAERMQ